MTRKRQPKVLTAEQAIGVADVKSVAVTPDGNWLVLTTVLDRQMLVPVESVYKDWVRRHILNHRRKAVSSP
jgi:hypothetical protein